MDKEKYILEESYKKKRFVLSGDAIYLLNLLLYNRENLEDKNILLFYLGQLKGIIESKGMQEYNENP